MSSIAPLFFLYLGVMGWLFQRRTQWLTRFGIFTTLLGALFVRYGFAVPFSDEVNPSVTHMAISPERLADYYIAVVIAYAGIFFGIVVFDAVWVGRRPVQVTTLAPTQLLALVAGIVMAIVLLVWVVIPWGEFVSGVYSFLPGHTAAGYRLHRVDYGAYIPYGSSGIVYLGSFARFALAPVVLWILFFHRESSRSLNIMFWLLLTILLTIGLTSGQKLPALLLVGGFVVALLIKRGRPSIVNWRFALAAAGFIGLVGPGLYLVQYPTLDYPTLVQLTVYRLTEEYSRTAQLRFVFYPDLHPFLSGLSSSVLQGVAGLFRIDVSAAQSPEVYIPANAGAGPSYRGTWNAGYLAEAWADFGFVGVAAASVAFGVIVRAIDRWYSASGQGFVEMGVYTAVCISALYVSEVASLTVLWTYGLGSAFIVYGLLRLLSRRRQSFAEVKPITSVSVARAN